MTTYRLQIGNDLTPAEITEILKAMLSVIPEAQKVWADENCPALAQYLVEND